MKTVGIIAEFNPFHNGHRYMIERARTLSGADFVVCVMSPDFVQRGECALVDKYARTRMALQSGADLVLELPLSCATGSAEYFAHGAVLTLHSLGCIDTLAFGIDPLPENGSTASSSGDNLRTGRSGTAADCAWASHSGDSTATNCVPVGHGGATADCVRTDCRSEISGSDSLSADAVLAYLREAAAFFALPRGEEPAAFRERLQALMRSGLTYPQARTAAFLETCSPGFPAELLRQPNCILAIEYLKAQARLGASFEVLAIPRAGEGYHSTALPDGSFCSASALRAAVRETCFAPAGVAAQGRSSMISRAARVSCFAPAGVTAQGLVSGTVTGGAQPAGYPDAPLSLHASAGLQPAQSADRHSTGQAYRPVSAGLQPSLPEQLRRFMPDESFAILSEESRAGNLTFMDDFDLSLRLRLMRARRDGEDLSVFQDVGTELGQRIFDKLGSYTGAAAFADACKSRQLTHARVRRALLHIFLDMRQSDADALLQADAIGAVRVLGLRRSAQPLLHAITHGTATQLITRPKNIRALTDDALRGRLLKDLYASEVREAAAATHIRRPAHSEFTRPLIIC